MNWTIFFAVSAGVVGTHIAQWIGRVVDDRRNWSKCPVSTCNFRFKINNDKIRTDMITDHVSHFHPDFRILDDR